ncbi:MAG: 1-acyl-sn-glycerol-3-phosphate acyltransferase [Clostridia bacterium]|nr:1-acyl-sn-glycerol-3-phosphate acyltransferase [Clostridia bacterium]
MYWILWILIAPWWRLFFPTKIIGKKKLKPLKNKATILSANHQSLNDPVLIKAKVKPTSKMMAKDSLFKNWFSKRLMACLGAYPVNREGNDLSAVKKTLAYLKEGKTVTIFPEGTRANAGDLSEMKNGLVMFALKTDSYVVPMIFRKKPKFLRLNTLVIGEPFKFSEIEEFKGVKVNKEVLESASKLLSEKMQYLKEVDLKEYKKSLNTKKM